jgi:hypothetical protein
MTDVDDWGKLAGVLRDLHRVLMERARRDYEREHSEILSPGALFRLLSTDPYFSWLRSLSELMVDIDMAREAEPADRAGLASAIRPAAEYLLSPPTAEPTTPFAQRYWPYVNDDPHVAMAHAAARQALAAWPMPEQADAATLLHERHRLAEKARHRPR